MSDQLDEFTVRDLEMTDRFLVAYGPFIDEPETIAKVRSLLSDEINRRS